MLTINRISRHLVLSTACLVLLFTSCIKKADIDQITPQTGVIQISPSSGTKNTTLSISGTNFPDKSGIVVKVNGKTVPIVTSTNNNIQVTIPANTGTGPVLVTFGGATYDGGTFTYLNTYTASSITNGLVGYLDGPVAIAKYEDLSGIAIDANGNLYNAQYGAGRVRKLNLGTMVVSTLAGDGSTGDADGTGAAAQFGSAEFVSTDAAGNVYIADQDNNKIRKITPAGVVSTIAVPTYAIQAIKVGKLGNIYVSYGTNIAKYSATGVLQWRLTSHGGSGNVDGDTSVVKFRLYGGIEVDDTETKIYVAQTTLSGVYPTQIKLLDLTTKTMKVIAGRTAGGYVDGDALDAGFSLTYGMVLDKTGGLYIADTFNNAIRYLKNGKVTTVMGGSDGDEDGVGLLAQFSSPQGLAFDAAGNLYISDWGNNKIKKVVID
jgi:sugar lactone lactonase YvrE